jgi:hypothetical protein
VKTHWGQRLGNTIAIVTLLTAAIAIWLLLSRKEPASRAPAPPASATEPR